MYSPSSEEPVCLVTVFPRHATGPTTGFVFIDLKRKQLTGVRLMPASESLVNSATGRPSHFRQLRGLAIRNGVAFAATFNAVNAYELIPDTAEMRLVGRYTHPTLCDTHGLRVDDQHLYVANTGTDSIVRWVLGREESGEVWSIRESAPAGVDLNFPETFAPIQGNWRASVYNQVHVNDVCVVGGQVFACSLHAIWQHRAEHLFECIHRDEDAIFHDGCPVGRQLAFTDASRGAITLLDPTSGAVSGRHQFVDPEQWFFRGMDISGQSAVALASERCTNRQLVVREGEPQIGPGMSELLVIQISLPLWTEVQRFHMSVPDFPKGSVAYKPAFMTGSSIPGPQWGSTRVDRWGS